MAARSQGPIERRVRADVRQIDTKAGVQQSLAELAFRLARTLDEDAGMATAAVARELRATLQVLMGAGDDGGRATELLARLSSAVGDSEAPGASNAWPPRRRGGGATG